MSKATVLVTGISGYIAKHVARELLEQGFAVRGTVRDIDKSERTKNDLASAGVDISKLEFVEVDLESDKGWADAVKGCRYIQHLASPFPMAMPKDREALVPAAKGGALRVLEAGVKAGAKSIVLTSSMVSMMGVPHDSEPVVIGEASWTNPEEKGQTAYNISKTRAEQAAWDFVKTKGVADRLVTINPGLVLGPAIGKTYGTSMQMIEQIFAGAFPAVPRVSLPVVDVRDVAKLHVAALTAEKVGGRRLIAVKQMIWMLDLVNNLKETAPTQAAKLPKRELPDFLVKFAAIFDARLRSIIPDLGVAREVDNAYVDRLTGLKFRPLSQTLSDACAYLSELGKI